MRTYILVVIIVSIVLLSCSDHAEQHPVNTISEQIPAETAKRIVRDTFSFENFFAEEPFLLKKETLSSVKELLGDTSLIKVGGPEKISDFEEELIDFSKDNSTITVFNNYERIGMIVYSAEISDSLPIFKHNVIVGMTKESLIKEFNLAEESVKANVFEVYSGEATSYVYLIFKSGILKKIVYWPYTG